MPMESTPPGGPRGYGLGSRPGEAAGAGTIFAQTMFLVAVTLGFLAAGARLGRDLPLGWALAAWAGALVLVIAAGFLRSAGAGQLGLVVLFAVGLLFGLALGPTLAAYAAAPGGATLMAQAAALTALFVAALGTAGYITERDLSMLGRISFVALLGLIAFAIVLLFVEIPGGRAIFAVAGLAVFAGYTLYDFWRLRRAGEDQVTLIALGIFLDIANVFVLILSLLGGNGR